MCKRILSMLLALVLLLGNVPVAALATEVPVVLTEEMDTAVEPVQEAPVEVIASDAAMAAADVVINEATFPDAIFRGYVTKFDVGYKVYNDETEQYDWYSVNDGVLTRQEIQQVYEINVGGMGIASLEGIQYFTALSTLWCQDNQLTSLDVSSNTALKIMNCVNNQLTSLDVSSNSALRILRCYENQLTTLNVSNNPALEALSCGRNQLTTLDVSGYTALTELSCYFNQLTSLDVRGCTALDDLYCDNNLLTSLDLCSSTVLTSLSCSSNQLTSLNVSGCSKLVQLLAAKNQLTSLDVSTCAALWTLDCGYNQLASLDVSSNSALEHLSCGGNKLTAIDVSSNPKLKSLTLASNQLTSLNVSSNPALEDLSLYNNKLTALDISKNPALRVLGCGANQLTTLDVSSNPLLLSLQCKENQLTSLDLSSNPQLQSLESEDNQYTITLDNDRTFDLTTLPGSFTVSKASNWSGGSVKGDTLTVGDKVESVTYTYDAGTNYTVDFTLLISAPAHTHSFTQKVATESCLKSAATCTKAAVYYLSCECGEKGTGTFTHGQPLGHNYQNGKCTRCGDAHVLQTGKVPVLTVSNVPASGKPKLNWNALAGAEKYQIWRSKTGKTGSFGLINTVKTLTATNSNAVAGTKYYYKVRAVLSDGTKTDYSNVVTITCDLARPTGVKITSNATTGKNVISWNAVAGASKYQVWYSTTGKVGSFKVLMTTKNLTHTHGKALAGTKYYYKVSAVHANTAANSALTGWFSRVCDLAAPSGVKITAGANGKNQITWKAVPGAAKYQVWSSKTGKAGSFTFLVTKNASALTHTHKGGVAGQMYYYKVKAIHTNTNANSAWSNVVSGTSK